MFNKQNKEDIVVDRYTKVYIYYLAVFFAICLVLGSVFLYQRVFIKEDLYIKPPKKFFVEEIVISRGDTMYQILSPYQISNQEIHSMINSVKSEIDLSKLKIKQKLWIRYSEDLQGERTPKSIMIQQDAQKKIKIEIKNDTYNVTNIDVGFTRSIVDINGTINGSIIKSGLLAGVPTKNLMQIINVYSNKIDFQRDVHKGDSFRMLIEKFISEDDDSSFFGKTIYASLTLNGKDNKVYLFKTAQGENYFDENGKSVKTSLMKKPTIPKRVSSHFGMRIHPILKTRRMHSGVDYAAHAGTPVYAAGDGKIIKIGRNGGYGKYIKIRHNAKLQTAYAHLKGYAKGLRRNSRVTQGQVIGYVGSTGSSTAPHLHYEVIVNGRFVNPLKMKSLLGKQLSGEEKKSFIQYREKIDRIVINEKIQDKKINKELKEYTF